MADLDNFFAKKDKKKKKGFSKANADIIIKNIEESERRSEQKAAAEEKAGGLATSEATKAALNNDHDGNKAEKAAASSASTGTGTSSSSNPSVSGNEPVLATTDAARQAHKMFGLSDDGTVKGADFRERESFNRNRERTLNSILLRCNSFLVCTSKSTHCVHFVCAFSYIRYYIAAYSTKLWFRNATAPL